MRWAVWKSNCRGASPPLLNNGLHAIDATPARWCGPCGGVVSHRSIQQARPRSPDSLVDVRTGDRADESLARPIPGTAQREIVVAAPPTRARRRSPVRRARTSTDAPPAPWREGVESCDRTIDEFRVMLSKRPTAAPQWRCLHCKTENEPVVDWCRLCRAGRIRVSLAIAS
jgi:hypothetical protein